MHFLKRLLRGFTSQLFKLAIVLLVITAALTSVFGTPERLKTTLDGGGLYTAASDQAFEEGRKQLGDDIPLDDPAVQAAAKSALSEELLKKQSHRVIDGIYGWLQGRTATPEFNLDLSNAKQQLAGAIGDAAVSRVKDLPVCTQAQLLKLDPNKINPFNLECRPPGLNLNAERTKLVNSITDNDEFLNDASLTADDLPKDDNGQTAFDQATVVPTVYQWVQKLPLILAGIALLSALLLCKLHDDWRRGVWLIGRALLITGLLYLVGMKVATYYVEREQFFAAANNPVLHVATERAGRTILAAINDVIFRFSVAYIIGGLISMLLIAYFHRKRVNPQRSAHEALARTVIPGAPPPAPSKPNETAPAADTPENQPGNTPASSEDSSPDQTTDTNKVQ